MIEYTIQSNIFALLVLLIVYKGAQKHTDTSRLRHRIFIYILIINALLLGIDSISIFLYDVPGEWVYVSQSFLTMVFYSLNPVPGFLWLLYVHDFIYHDMRSFKKLSTVGLVPVLINVALSLASIWGGYLYLIGEGNSYQRGAWFLLVPLFAFSYTGIAFVIIFLNRDRIPRQEWLALQVFALPPMIGGLLQTFIYGMVTLWPSLSISILIIYVFIQSKEFDTDFLTGLNNRRSFDYHLDDWRKWKKDDRLIAGFMMDMDRFKDINDTFGHQTGDKALVEMSQIIRESFRKNDFIARIGGDEFAAVIEVKNPEEIEVIKERLTEKVRNFNQLSRNGYSLSISSGGDVFNPEKYGTLPVFFEALDNKMYEEKTHKRSLRKH